jgi:hypothetical protein
MGFDQYHEPAQELPQRVRTFARMIKSLIEEAEAIDWYEQRLYLKKDKEAKKNNGSYPTGRVYPFCNGPGIPVAKKR